MESSETIGPQGYRIGTRTDIGLRRKRNEDFLGVEKTPAGMLLVVCDGMGGHVGGERASRMAVETFISAVRTGSGDHDALMKSALEKANRAVYDEAMRSPDLKGMGTTLVAALISDNRATVINLGDSRAYHMQQGRLSRVSTDHSLVGELVAQGRLTESEARVHPQRNIITQALGLDPTVAPDIYHVPLRDGDALLLCSDGLYGMAEDKVIERIVAGGGAPERICDDLIQAALAGGGDDNVSVALLLSGEVTKAARLVAEPETVDPRRESESEGSGNVMVWVITFLLVGGGGYFLYDQLVPAADPVAVDSTAIRDSSLGTDSMLVDSSVQVNPSEQIDSLLQKDSTSGLPADSSNPGDTNVQRGRDSIGRVRRIVG